MRLLILASLLVLGSAKHIDISKFAAKCSVGGPEYWCQNEDTARRCSATNYCQENVWAKQQGSDDVCQECMEIVELVHSKVSDAKFKSSVLNVVTSTVCGNLPAAYQEMCKSLAENYLSQIMDQVATATSQGKALCSQVGLCSGSKKAYKQMKVLTAAVKKLYKLKQKPTSDACTTCEQYVGTIHLVLSNKETKTEVLNEITSLCQQYGGGSVCSLIASYGGELYDELVNYLATPEKLCQLIGICPKPQLQIGADMCTTCEQYVGTVHLLLDNKGTKTQVLTTLTQLCEKYAGGAASLCPLINSYGGQVYDKLVAYLAKPQQLCTTLGLCSGFKAIPLMHMQSTKNLVKLSNNFLVSAKKNVKGIDVGVCEVCTFAVGYVDNMLKDSSTQQELKNVALGLCGDLPPSVKDMCKSYVNNYWAAVVGVLIDELADSKAICTTLHMCTSKAIKVPSLKTNKDPPVSCLVCEFAMGFLDNRLSNKATKDEVKAELDKACNLLPSSVSRECETLVNEFSDVIINLIVEQLAHPTTICRKLSLCPSAAKINKKAIVKASVKADPVSCQVCEYAMKYLDGILEQNSTEAEVKQVLDQVCGYLPASAKDECTALVNQYADTIIKLIVEELADPKTICTELGLCSSKIKVLKKPIIKASIKGSPVTCEVCEYAMTYLKSLLKENATEEEVKEVLDKLCGYLPASIKGECTTLVNQYSDQIINLIVQELADPKTICTELGLCSSKIKVLKKPIIKASVKANPVSCEVCEYAMQYLDTILEQNSTEEEVKQVLDQMCGYLPASVKDECTSLVDQYSDMIIKLIVQELADPKTICTELGLCSSNTKVSKKHFVKASVKANPIECELCEYAMKYLESMITTNSTEEEVKEALDKLCAYLPSSLKTECTALVDQYADQIIKLIVDELASPSEICKELGLCSSKTKVLKKPIIKASVKANPVECEVCKTAMQYLDSLLEQNSTEAEVKDALDQVCSYLPDSVKSECTSLVDQYTDTIVKLIVEELANPDEICKALGLCSSAIKMSKKPVVKASVKANPVSCEVCELAMQYLDNYLKENATEAEVKEALDEMCGYLPASVRTECTTLVNQYADTIIKLIVQELADPATICKELGLCSAKSKLLKKPLVKASVKANPVTCEVCKYAMTYLEKSITKNATEEEVREALDKLCGYLPDAIKGECKSLVDQYTDTIIKLIVEELASPDTICQELGLCTSRRKVSKKPFVKASVKGNPVTCEVCEYAMKYLDKMLEQNSTEEEVKEALDKLCSYLPASMKTECTSLVNQYTDQIIKLIVDELADPKTICTEIGLCTASKKVKSIKRVQDDLKCTVCEDALEVLENIIKENKTEAAIKNGLDKLCSYLPSAISSECTELVNEYGDEILKLLLSEVNPDMICKALTLCPSAVKKALPVASKKKGVQSGMECELCNFMMGKLMSELKDNATESEIKTALQGLCTKLPAHLNDECNLLITKYFDLIVKIITTEDATVVCQYIGLCPSLSKSYHGTRKEMLAMRLSLHGVSCEVCEAGMGYLDSVLTKKSSEKEIEQAVVSLCSHLPAVIKNECDALITEYGDELIKLIVQQLEPEKVCKALKIC